MTQNHPSRRERKKIEVRHKIEEAALMLFEQKGFNDTSIAEIMAKADLGTGTFYNYFNSKEDLVATFINDTVNEAKQDIEAIVGKQIPADEKLSRILLVAGKTFEKYKPLIAVFIQLKENVSGERTPLGHGIVFREILLKVIEEGQQDKEIRPGIPPEVIVQLMHAMLQSALLSKSTSMTLTENLNHMINVFLNGVKTKGDDQFVNAD